MQKLVTYGLLTSLCGLLTFACADSEGERPGVTAGTGGTVAQGGTGGTAGTGGAGGSGGTPGAGGTGSAAPAACSSCLEATVALTEGGMYRQAQFLIRMGGTTVYDLSNALVTFRVRLVTPASEIPGEQIFVTPFAQNGETPNNYAGVFRPQTILSSANGFDPASETAWQDITLDLANTAPFGEIVTPPAAGGDAGVGDAGVDGGEPTGGGEPTLLDNMGGLFDKSQVFQYGLQVGALAAFTGTGNVHIAIDSITYRTVDNAPIEAFPDVTFDMGNGGLQLDMYNVPPGTVAPIARPQ
jgi:hypothetical protein